MALQTATIKNALASAYGTTATQAALYSTVPGTSAGTEITGGTYARKAINWSAPVQGVSTATVVFDVPAGATVRGAGVHNASGTYLDGGSLPEQPVATAATYTVNLTTTIS
jgi:hypothetical protein